MRIIAGSARSRLILAPQGQDTRPTLDRVRESLFSILLPHTRGAKVLDLFAGSGALALEALSRGAEFALMVDSDRQAHQAEKSNVQALGFEKNARVVLMDWRQALLNVAPEYAPFDLVFLDPPYRMTDLAEVGEALKKVISADALIVLEHDEKAEPAFSPAYERVDRRKYGKAGISFCRLKEDV